VKVHHEWESGQLLLENERIEVIEIHDVRGLPLKFLSQHGADGDVVVATVENIRLATGCRGQGTDGLPPRDAGTDGGWPDIETDTAQCDNCFLFTGANACDEADTKVPGQCAKQVIATKVSPCIERPGEFARHGEDRKGAPSQGVSCRGGDR
jgi:hypothetical protein